MNAPSLSAVAGALTGLLLWILQEYVFKGTGVPEAVEAAVLICVPALLSWLASLLSGRAATTAAAARAQPPAPAHAPQPPDVAS